MDIGPWEAETFWTEFLRKLRRRGLRGVKSRRPLDDTPDGAQLSTMSKLRALARIPPKPS